MLLGIINKDRNKLMTQNNHDKIRAEKQIIWEKSVTNNSNKYCVV